MNSRKSQTLTIATLTLLVLMAAGLATGGISAQVRALFSQDLTMQESTSTTSSGMPMGGGRGGGDQQSTNTNYFSGSAMLRTSSDGNDSMIRFDQSKMVQIDHKKKTYSEMTFEQLQQMLDNASAEMNKAMGSNAQAAEMMKQMMGGMGGSVSVTKEGPGETIAGYATEKYLVKMPPVEMQIWATPDLTIPAVYYDVLKMRMPRNPMFDMSKLYDEFKKIKGMTLKSITTVSMVMGPMNMKSTTTTVVTSVEKGAIPASKFDIPAGYKAQPFKP